MYLVTSEAGSIYIIIDIHKVLNFVLSTIFKKALKTCSPFSSHVSVSKITATGINVYLDRHFLVICFYSA